MNPETKTVEQILRDNGWIETTLENCRAGDPVLILDRGFTGTVIDNYDPASSIRFIDLSDEEELDIPKTAPALRAPRPETEYEPGTVVWGRVSGQYEHQTLTRLGGEHFPWIGVDRDTGLRGVWSDKAVEVDHVIAYPDGSTPAPVLGPVTDEQAMCALDAEYRVWRKAVEPILGKEFTQPRWCETQIDGMRAALEAYRGTLTGWADQEDGE